MKVSVDAAVTRHHRHEARHTHHAREVDQIDEEILQKEELEGIRAVLDVAAIPDDAHLDLIPEAQVIIVELATLEHVKIPTSLVLLGSLG